MHAPDFMIDHGCKSFPLSAEPVRASAIAARGLSVPSGDLAFPIAVLRESALVHNLNWMQAFARRKGIELAPHGKTTMSPQLFARQLQAGAWGITLATAFQVQTAVQAGVRRIIVANQVVCDADLDTLDLLLHRHDGLRVMFLVDSLAQLALIADWSKRRASSRQFEVLLEMGIPGGRTGCRSLEQALALAQAVSISDCARLVGLECYEGGAARCETEHDVREVSALVRRAIEVARALDGQSLFAEAEILITAGGSAVFDLVVPLLRAQGLARPVRGVLRSGCYLTHDHGNYARYLALVERREGLQHSLQPALEVWSMVQSVPEPGLALLTCGRRDISYDIDMPLPVRWARGQELSAQDVPTGWHVSALNDQHAYLRFPAEGPQPAVGDRVVLGISHPCTTFDKWRWMPVIDDDGRVVGAVETRF